MESTLNSNRQTRELAVELSVDGLTLHGVLHLPTVSRPPLVIGLHGLFSDSASPKQVELARACNGLGMAYFRLDHRGCGRSQGDFEEVTSLPARCRDLIATVAHLRDNFDLSDRLGLFGSSMGGAVALAAGHQLTPQAIVTVAAPIRSAPLTEAARAPDYDDHVPARFFEDRLQFDISEAVDGLRYVLLFHGDCDTVVPYDHAREIFERAAKPKKLITQPGGDHRISYPPHQRDFIHNTSIWLHHWLTRR